MSRTTTDPQRLGRATRSEQVEHTRARILATAERLFAEHGVNSVSNRQISEAAGQGNNTAVGYHFGTKADLVRAIIRRHAGPTERLSEELLRRYGDSDDLRDWVTCIVRPFTGHLAALDPPTWYARFAAQLLTEPRLRELASAEMHDAPALQTVYAGLNRCLPDLPPDVRTARAEMAHTLLVHLCAQRERILPADPAAAAEVWSATAAGLIDAIEGLFRAPVTPAP
ncbi:TetR/AcrR family transcriptional regulator [Actinoplanes sp. NPDC049265]|uniref:TetR/AcrR family transcriptional regulator n=1 Tax=Actinoplanes sp. NPDC049265 TaxID=3363902 RepID=UPI003720D0E3